MITTFYQDEALNAFIRGLPANLEDSWNRLLRHIGHWASMRHGLFAVRRLSDERIIGEVGFENFRRELGDAFDNHPEAAWMFRGDAHGQGFAFEAMTAATRWFEADIKLQTTVCIIDPQNTGSLRLAAKLGYEAFGAGVYRGGAVTMLTRTPAPRSL